MAAFCFFDVREVLDAEKLAAYRAAVLQTVRRHGGRYRIMGGACESLEGDWRPNFPVLIEFPDCNSARAWYRSREYAGLKALRIEGSRGDAVLIDSGEDSEFLE